jgi:chromosome segregation ATPase
VITAAALLNLIVGALAVLGVLIGGFGYYRGNALRQDITDRDKRIEFLEKESDRYKELSTDQATEITSLKTKVVSLEQYRDAQAGPLRDISEEIRLLHDVLSQLMEAIRQSHELIVAHHDTAKAGFATIELQNIDALRLLGDRRTATDESVTREVGHDQ